MKFTIKLDQFEINIEQRQLTALLAFGKLAAQYQKAATGQEALRKFRVYRPIKTPGIENFDARAWWRYAYRCIKMTIKSQKGTWLKQLAAFKLGRREIDEMQTTFKTLVKELVIPPNEEEAQKVIHSVWSDLDRATYWHIISVIETARLKNWVRDIVVPVERRKFETQKIKQEKAKKQGYFGSLFAPKDSEQDDLEAFFQDVNDTEGDDDSKASKNIRENTSLVLQFNYNALSLTFGKESKSDPNKIEGIQVFTHGAMLSFESPTLNMEQFRLNLRIDEWGISLITVNLKTDLIVDCTQVVMTNKAQLLQSIGQSKLGQNQEVPPQCDLQVTKNDPSLADQGIVYDVALQIGSVLYKYFEDMIVRGRDIFQVKVDKEVTAAAKHSVDDFKVSTTSKFRDMIDRRKNRYVISIQSPVFVLPIRSTFSAKFSPVWVLRTGDMLIISANLRDDEQLMSKARTLTQQNRICKNGEEIPQFFVVNDQYEGYRITLTSIGLQYFASNKLYEESYNINHISNNEAQVNKPSKITMSALLKSPKVSKPAKKPNEWLEEQSLKHFNVLENFEIKVLIKFKKKANAANDAQTEELHRLMPETAVSVHTSPIKINLSHYIYNQLVNMAKIFEISKEKTAEQDQKNTSKHQKKKKGILKGSLLQGYAQRKVFPNAKDQRIWHWQKNQIILTNKRVYFYLNEEEFTPLQQIELTSIETVKPSSSVWYGKDKYVLDFKLFPQESLQQESSVVQVNFETKEEMSKWHGTLLVLMTEHSQDIFNTKVRQQLSKSHDFKLPEQIQQTQQTKFQKSLKLALVRRIKEKELRLKNEAILEEKRKQAIAVKFEFYLALPLFKINLQKLKLTPDKRNVDTSKNFEEWVSLELQDMNVIQEQRLYDSTMRLTLKKIILTDMTMIANRTLLFQEASNQNQKKSKKAVALIVMAENQTEESPRFNGLLDYKYIEMADVRLNFKPNTFNMMLKFFSANRYFTKPVNDHFMIAHEYPTDFKNPTEDQESEQSSEKEKEETNVFDTDCSRERTQTSKLIFVCKGGRMSMLHPIYEMELFRLETARLEIEMQNWYDHMQFGTKLASTTLSDLTGYPYTVNPKTFYEQTKAGAAPSLPKPIKFFQWGNFNMLIESYYNPNCPRKPKDFASRLELRITPLSMNYMQEQVFRLYTYFFEQFLDTIWLSDPYADPKSTFEELVKRKVINADQINEKTNFKQPEQIGMLDIKINQAELKIRDRPQSMNYLLFSIPQIEVSCTTGSIFGRFSKMPEVQLKTQIMTTKLEDAMIYYCQQYEHLPLQTLGEMSQKFALLQKNFSITVETEQLCWSDVIEKINPRDLDKSPNYTINFDPLLFVLPQQIYTYILRCSDLNFMYTDLLDDEFHFAKWSPNPYKMDYSKFTGIVDKTLFMNMPALSLSLQNNDNSFLAELILQDFQYEMTRYMDTASDQTINCQNFFILDQSQKEKPKRDSELRQTAGFNFQSTHMRQSRQEQQRETFAPIKPINEKDEPMQQAIICPIHWPMSVRSADIINLHKQKKQFGNDVQQFKCKFKMKPNGDKHTTLRIEGLKIFTKLQLFIKIQTFFMTAWPKYDETSHDKPIGFTTDEDKSPKMEIVVEVVDSLICLLNRPGFKSIACQGDIYFANTYECIGAKKQAYNRALRQMQQEEGLDFESHHSKLSDDLVKRFEEASIVAVTKIKLSQFTPFICSLSHLDSSNVNFKTIKKRQLLQPLDIQMEVQYKLTKYKREQVPLNVDLASNSANRTPEIGKSSSDPPFDQKKAMNTSQLVNGNDSQLISHASQATGQKQKWQWGITMFTAINIGKTKVKISLQDIALIMQITNFANDQIATETVQTLQELHEKIESSKRSSEIDPEQMLAMEEEKQEFDEFIERIDGKQQSTHSVSEQVNQLRETVHRFTLLKLNQAQNRLSSKGNLLDFLKQDALKGNNKQPETKDEDIEDEHEQLEESRRRTINQGKRQKKKDSWWQRNKYSEVEERTSSQEDDEDSPIKPSKKKYIIESDDEIDKDAEAVQNEELAQPVPKSLSQDILPPSKKGMRQNLMSSIASTEQRSSEVRSASLYQSAASTLAAGNKIGVSGREHAKSILVESVEDNSDAFYSCKDSVNLTKSLIEPKHLLEAENLLVERGISIELATHIYKDEAAQKPSDAQLKEKEDPPTIYNNIRKDSKITNIDDITILLINDFEKAFTPVVEIEFLDVSVAQSNDNIAKSSKQEIAVALITAAYYNLELSEWEPLLENMSCDLKIESNLKEIITSVQFNAPIMLNVTDGILHNVIHTHQSWMASPDYIFGAKFNTKHLNNAESKAEELIPVEPDVQWLNEDDTKIDSVTPFLILNQTPLRLKIVQGGLSKRASDLSQFHSSIRSQPGPELDKKLLLPINESIVSNQRLNITSQDSTFSQKQYKLAPGTSCDYAVRSQVTQNKLSKGNRNTQAKMFKTSEIVGVLFENNDMIKEVDLNQISETNPYIYKLQQYQVVQPNRPTEGDADKNFLSTFANSKLLGGGGTVEKNHEQNMEERKNGVIRLNDLQDKNLLKWRQTTNLAYGVKIEKMRKVLIIRSPYVFNNRTKLNYEIRVLKVSTGHEVSRFKLAPDSKYALDFEYYQSSEEYSIQVKVLPDETLVMKQGTFFSKKMQQVSKDSNLGLENRWRNLGDEDDRSPRVRTSEAGFSQSALIHDLLKLRKDQGSGAALLNNEENGFCTCIKKMSGELKDTIDFVLLPPLIIKNTLPCYIEIKAPVQAKKTLSNYENLDADIEKGAVQPDKKKPLVTDRIEKSEEKHFYLFSPVKVRAEEKKESNSEDPRTLLGYKLHFGIGGYLSLTEDQPILFNYQRPQDVTLYFFDERQNAVQVKVRVNHDRAGFHLTFYAETIVCCETVRLLSNHNLWIQYEQSYLDRVQRLAYRPLAGIHGLDERRYLLCNPEQKITVGIKLEDQEPFMSNPIDITVTGEEEFSIYTQSLEKIRKRGSQGVNMVHQKFDMVASTTISLSDYNESVYTKVVLISPKFVLVNNLNSTLEVGQLSTDQHIHKILNKGDKCEWYWPDSRAAEQISIRIQSNNQSVFDEQPDLFSESEPSEQSSDSETSPTLGNKTSLLTTNVPIKLGKDKEKSPKSDDQSPKLLDKSNPRTTKYDDTISENPDANVNWAWSRGIRLSEEKQMTWAMMIREATNNEFKRVWRTKIVKVSKKKVNSTIFVIFEDEDPRYPMYRIINDCDNVKVNFCQASLANEMKPDLIEPCTSQPVGFYDPHGTKQVQLLIEINKNTTTALTEMQHRYVARSDLWFTKQQQIDFDCVTNYSKEITFTSVFDEKHQIQITYSFDGQTKTLKFRKVILVDEDNAFKSKRKKNAEGGKSLPQSKGTESVLAPDKLRLVYHIELQKFCLSLIGKVQEMVDDQIVLTRKEFALVTLKGFNLYSDQKQSTGDHDIEVAIQHFQIDNQMELNPLFQQILVPKVYVGRGLVPRGGRHANTHGQFFILKAQTHTTDNQVTILEKFDARLAEIAIQMDDEILNDLSFFAFSIAAKIDVGTSGMHPIFLKDSHFDKIDPRTEAINRFTVALQWQSEAEVKDPVLLKRDSARKSQALRRSMPKQQRGVFLVTEKVNTFPLETYPAYQRKWYQQDITKNQAKMFVQDFVIDNISAEVSFIFKTKASDDINFVGPLRHLKMSGLSLINIDEANFKLKRLTAEQLYIGTEDFSDFVSNYYTRRIIRELSKMALSIGFFGSPRTLVKFFRDGVYDLVEMPVEGWRNSGVGGAVVGIGHGTLSLTKNIGVGTVQSVQTMSNSLSHAMVLLGQDKDYARQRQGKMLNERPKNFVEGFGYGCKATISSLTSAAFGTVYRPVVEARRGGLRGFFYGVYQGTTGLLLKPSSGVFDLFSKSCEGVKNTLRALEKRQRRDRIRYPRPFYGQQRLIKPYSDDDALLVCCVLPQIFEGKYKNDHYLEVKLVKPPNMNPHFLLLTQEHLFFIEAAQRAVVWQIRTTLIKDIMIMANGILIRFTRVYIGREQVGLPLDDESSHEVAQWLNAIHDEFI